MRRDHSGCVLDTAGWQAHTKPSSPSARAMPPASPALIHGRGGLRRYLVELRDPRRWRRTGSSIEAEGPQEIVAPMPGKIVKVLVTEGQEVSRGQGLLVIEAMKMQNELRAPRAGRVERIYIDGRPRGGNRRALGAAGVRQESRLKIQDSKLKARNSRFENWEAVRDFALSTLISNLAISSSILNHSLPYPRWRERRWPSPLLPRSD